MLNHFDIATEGLRKDHRWIARLGFFLLEIIPKPPKDDGIGGGGTYYEPEEYIVRVTVTFKGKQFTQEKTMTSKGIKTLEKVIAFFKKATPLFDKTQMLVKYIGQKLTDMINVRAFKREKDDSK